MKKIAEFLKTASPIELFDFRDFLKGKLNCENLTFWLDVEEYKSLQESELTIRAQQLCEIYLSDSTYQLNISSALKEEVLRQIANPTRTMFDNIQQAVLQLLAEGPFIEYMASERYTRLKGSSLNNKLICR